MSRQAVAFPPPVDYLAFLVAVVAAVRALHCRYADGNRDCCAHCNWLTGDWIPYPCRTIRTLDSALADLPFDLKLRLGVGQ